VQCPAAFPHYANATCLEKSGEETSSGSDSRDSTRNATSTGRDGNGAGDGSLGGHGASSPDGGSGDSRRGRRRSRPASSVDGGLASGGPLRPILGDGADGGADGDNLGGDGDALSRAVLDGGRALGDGVCAGAQEGRGGPLGGLGPARRGGGGRLALLAERSLNGEARDLGGDLDGRRGPVTLDAGVGEAQGQSDGKNGGTHVSGWVSFAESFGGNDKRVTVRRKVGRSERVTAVCLSVSELGRERIWITTGGDDSPS